MDGWQVTALADVVYPGLILGAGPTKGLLLNGLTADEWCVIDAFEDEIYHLRPIDLVGGRQALAYTCPPGSDAPTGAAWDERDFAENHLTNYLIRCAAWLARYQARGPKSRGASR